MPKKQTTNVILKNLAPNFEFSELIFFMPLVNGRLSLICSWGCYEFGEIKVQSAKKTNHKRYFKEFGTKFRILRVDFFYAIGKWPSEFNLFLGLL